MRVLSPNELLHNGGDMMLLSSLFASYRLKEKLQYKHPTISKIHKAKNIFKAEQHGTLKG